MGILAVYLLLLAPVKHSLVAIKDCRGKFMPIYLDKALTAPLANPLVSDSDGRVEFYAAPSACYKIEIVKSIRDAQTP